MDIEERSEASFAVFGKVQVAQNRQRQRHRDCPQRQFDPDAKASPRNGTFASIQAKIMRNTRSRSATFPVRRAWTARGIRNCSRLTSPFALGLDIHIPRRTRHRSNRLEILLRNSFSSGAMCQNVAGGGQLAGEGHAHPSKTIDPCRARAASRSRAAIISGASVPVRKQRSTRATACETVFSRAIQPSCNRPRIFRPASMIR